MTTPPRFAVALIVLFASVASAQSIRCYEERLCKAIEHGKQSTTFNQLVSDIESRHALVFVSLSSSTRLPNNVAAVLKHVNAYTVPHVAESSDGTRMIHVHIVRYTGALDALSSTIGHELRHVLELLDNNAQHIPVSDGITETLAAQEVGTAVLVELRSLRP